MSSLTEQEQAELIRLMGKVTFPLPQEVFYAWSKAFTTVAAEVALIRNKDTDPEIFLIRRKDVFYDGWHIPGSIHLPNESLEDTLRRVITDELLLPFISREFWKWTQYPLGIGAGENPRGDVVSLIFICREPVSVTETPTARFFPFSQIPKDILPIHAPILATLHTALSQS